MWPFTRKKDDEKKRRTSGGSSGGTSPGTPDADGGIIGLFFGDSGPSDGGSSHSSYDSGGSCDSGGGCSDGGGGGGD